MENNVPVRTHQERREQDVLHRKLQSGLFGGIFVAALLGISLAALVNSAAGHSPRRPTPSLAPERASVVIRGANKLGPDGQRHDSWSVTSYHVEVGRPLQLRIDNRDDAPHTMTAPEAGISILAEPGVHTYTIVVQRAGRFRWFCRLPCDKWAMAHSGYMAGWIRAT